jgi:hypothetical protein
VKILGSLQLKRLETYGIPDLQFDLFGIDRDHSSTELNANCQIMNWLKAFVGELQQKA